MAKAPTLSCSSGGAHTGTHCRCRGAGPAPDRLAPPHPVPSGPHSARLEGAPRCNEVGARLPPRVAGALSRRSRPGSGCNHGKESRQPERQGLPLPGDCEGTLGAAALAGQGGRYCPWPRVQTRHCWLCAPRHRSQVIPSERSCLKPAATPRVLPKVLKEGIGQFCGRCLLVASGPREHRR